MSYNIDREYENKDLSASNVEATYCDEYADIIEKVKYRLPDGDKTFRCYFTNPLDFSERHATGLTKDRYTVKEWKQYPELGELPAVPLFCQEAIESAEKSVPAFICEGEEDARLLKAMGYVATTNFDGARKWQERYTKVLEGRHCILLQDEDVSGVEHCLNAAKALYGRAESVKIVRLPNLPHKGDFRDWYNAQKADGLTDNEIREKLDGIVKETKKWKPVYVADGQLISMIDRTERELVDRLAGVYTRGGSLVRAVKTEAVGFKDSKTAAVKMSPLSADSLREIMGRCMVFKKATKKKLKGADGAVTEQTIYHPTNPPRDVAQTLLAPGRSSSMPEVAGIVSCPTLRPNGSVLDRAGYDAATGLLVVDPISLPKDMPAAPTRACGDSQG